MTITSPALSPTPTPTPVPGTVYWITGLSGAGKTTLGRGLAAHLRAAGRPVVHLDGDVLRTIFGQRDAYSSGDRSALAHRYAHLCQEIAVQGVDVVCSTISLFHAVQRWNRESLPRYVEIFLQVPESALRARDQRRIYAHPDAKVGVDIAPEFPLAPDIVIDNHGDIDADAALAIVLTALADRTPSALFPS